MQRALAYNASATPPVASTRRQQNKYMSTCIMQYHTMFHWFIFLARDTSMVIARSWESCEYTPDSPNMYNARPESKLSEEASDWLLGFRCFVDYRINQLKHLSSSAQTSDNVDVEFSLREPINKLSGRKVSTLQGSSSNKNFFHIVGSLIERFSLALFT